MFRHRTGTRTRCLWDDRTRLVDKTVQRLKRFRINEKKVDEEEIEDYLGKRVKGFIKWKLRDIRGIKADEIRERYPDLCWDISRSVENISKAVLNHEDVPMYKVIWSVKGLFQDCDTLVRARRGRRRAIIF